MAQKNNKSVSAKKAVPGGVKSDSSFTKRSGGPQKMDAGRWGPREEYGPRQSMNAGGKVSDDMAGTKERANLPPATINMKAPEATLPKEALDMASPTPPIPSADTPLFTVEPFDYARDRRLGRMGS